MTAVALVEKNSSIERSHKVLPRSDDAKRGVIYDPSRRKLPRSTDVPKMKREEGHGTIGADYNRPWSAYQDTLASCSQFGMLKRESVGGTRARYLGQKGRASSYCTSLQDNLLPNLTHFRLLSPFCLPQTGTRTSYLP